MAKLELLILAGAETKKFLADLTSQINRLEKLSKGKKGKADEEDEDEETDDDDDDDDTDADESEDDDSDTDSDEDDDSESDDDADEDDDADSDDEDAEEGEDDEKPAKGGKVTKTAVNAACKKYAKKHGFEKTKKLLKKKFGSASINSIDAKKFAAVVKALEV